MKQYVARGPGLAPTRRRRAARPSRDQRRSPTPSCSTAPAAWPAALARRRRAARRRGWAWRSSRREDLAVTLHGCLLHGAVAVPIDVAPARRSSRSTTSLAAEPDRPAGARHRRPRPRRAGDRRPHVGDDERAQAGRADLRQLAVERAGQRGRARPPARRALAVRAAAHPRRRPVDPAAQSVIAGTTVLLHERWSTEAVLLAPRRRDDRLARPDDARAAARRGPGRAAGAALGAARRRADPARAARARRTRPACRSRRPTA